MSSTYKFHKPPERQAFSQLPEGDYQFIVSSVDEPYEKNNKWILSVRLAIQPDGTPVFANPWSGKTKDGEERDGIAEFLLAINRAPRDGEEPDWSELAGARGKCHLKQEEAQMGALAGKMVNKVAWFIVPKQLGPQAKQSVSKSEFEKARKAQEKASGGGEDESDSIPY